MPSKAHSAFTANKADIERLGEIHTEVAGKGRGRKHDVEVLNRATIVFITACWESYVEDLALEAFDHMVANATSADQIPSKVRALAVTALVESTASRKQVWALAGDGWRKVLKNHRTEVKKAWVDSLNTPKSKQVATLFKDLLGLTSLHESWHWSRMNATDAAKKLDNFITVRGQIAHRLKLAKGAPKGWGRSYLNHVERLVDKTDQKVASHLAHQLGAAPW